MPRKKQDNPPQKVDAGLTDAEIRERLAIDPLDLPIEPVNIPDPQDDFSPPPTEDEIIKALIEVNRQVARAEREAEKLRKLSVSGLDLYEPYDAQLEFLDSNSPQQLLIGSNRAGKTLTATVKFLRLCLARPGGRAVIVAPNNDHNANVVWPKMAKRGAFQVVWDSKKNKWRPYVPDEDKHLKGKQRPSPPLLRKGDIKSLAWYDKKAGVPRRVVLQNGCEIRFYSSEGEPPMGFAADIVWFEEEIRHPGWYGEVAARGTVDVPDAVFIWSATPLNATQDMYSRYEVSLSPQQHIVRSYFLHVKDNKYLSEEAKRDFYDKIASEEERRVRYDGQFRLVGLKVYPELSELIGGQHHGVEAFCPPADWCRYIAVDPGRETCAALFAAIPPNSDDVHFYDEIYQKKSHADRFAVAMREKVGDFPIEAFIIDWNAGRAHSIGRSDTVEEHYAAAFRRQGVKSRQTGHFFVWGSNDTRGREESLRRLLIIQPGMETPRLKIHIAKCPNLIYEMKIQRYVRRGELVTDKREDRIPSHLVDCAEYLAAHGMPYRASDNKVGRKLTFSEEWDKRHGRRQWGGDGPTFRLGPGLLVESN